MNSMNVSVDFRALNKGTRCKRHLVFLCWKNQTGSAQNNIRFVYCFRQLIETFLLNVSVTNDLHYDEVVIRRTRSQLKLID